jgi:hypothetical protein
MPKPFKQSWQVVQPVKCLLLDALFSDLMKNCGRLCHQGLRCGQAVQVNDFLFTMPMPW